MLVSTEVIAALAGAGAGFVSSILVEAGRWFFGRGKRAKAIKVALYYEISRHHIYEVARERNGDPNFMLLGFSRAAYDAYLDEIPDLLPERLVGEISNYYADVTTAADQLIRIEEDAANVRDTARDLVRLQSEAELGENPPDPDELDLATQAGEQVAHRMLDMMTQTRKLLATAMWQQKKLLANLRTELPNPTRLALRSVSALQHEASRPGRFPPKPQWLRPRAP